MHIAPDILCLQQESSSTADKLQWLRRNARVFKAGLIFYFTICDHHLLFSIDSDHLFERFKRVEFPQGSAFNINLVSIYFQFIVSFRLFFARGRIMYFKWQSIAVGITVDE